MKILICQSVLKNEIKPLSRHFNLPTIKKYIQKAAKGLAQEIKTKHPLPKMKLLKVYLTGHTSAARMIVLLQVEKQYYIPVLLRLKKDKIIGNNLSKNNQRLQKLLTTRLQSIKRDLKNKDFRAI